MICKHSPATVPSFDVLYTVLINTLVFGHRVKLGKRCVIGNYCKTLGPMTSVLSLDNRLLYLSITPLGHIYPRNTTILDENKAAKQCYHTGLEIRFFGGSKLLLPSSKLGSKTNFVVAKF